MEATFLKKTSLLPVETVFLPSEKQFFTFLRYSWLWKEFSSQVETYFLTSSPFQQVETDFLFSGNSIPFFITLLKFLKFGGSNFF